MSTHALDQAWLTSWRSELNRALEPLLATFESTYGYPPGENQVTEGGEDRAARQLNAHPDTPPALTAFYQAIHEVLLPDIGNGYFVHPAEPRP